MEHLGANKTSI
jgi:hypothetical protein